MSTNALREIVSKRFSRYTHATNPSVWNAIEKELDAKKSQRMTIWFWLLNGLAASFFIGMILWPQAVNESEEFLSIEQNQKPELKTNTAKNVPINETNAPKSEHEATAPSLKLQEMSTDYIYFTDRYNTFSRPKVIELFESSATENNQITDQNEGESTQFTVASLVVNSLTKLELNPINRDIIEQVYPSNVSVKRPFHTSIYIGIQSAYLTGARPASPPTNSFPPSPPILDRTFEFTLFSQFGLARNFSTGIGVGYATTTASTSESYQTDASSVITSTNYRKSVFSLPVQAKYTLLSRSRFSLEAGLIIQPEFVQLFNTQTSEIIPSGSLALTSESILLEPISNKQTGNQLAIEPFAQVDVMLLPRFSIYSSLGYRRYLKTATFETIMPESVDKMTLNIGLKLRLR